VITDLKGAVARSKLIMEAVTMEKAIDLGMANCATFVSSDFLKL